MHPQHKRVVKEKWDVEGSSRELPELKKAAAKTSSESDGDGSHTGGSADG